LGNMALGAMPGTSPAVYTSVALCSYAANAQVFARFHVDPLTLNYVLDNINGRTRIPGDISDGSSNTILFSERYANAGYYNDQPPGSTGYVGQGGAAWAWWGSYLGPTSGPPSGVPPTYGTNFYADTAVPMFAFPPYVRASSVPQVSP